MLTKTKTAMRHMGRKLLNHARIPIKIKKDGLVFKAVNHDGKEWFVPTNNKKIALWAYEFMESHERYLNIIRAGDIVVEVGACTGEYTLPAAQRADKIFAFEADPLACECVRKNAKIYNLGNIKVINEAVSNKLGRKMSLHTPNKIISGGLLVKNGQMVTTTLDEYLKDTKVDVLKLTVNGHEPEVLMGAKKLLKNVRFVIFQSAKHKQLIKMLKEEGFHVKKSEELDDGVEIVLLGR